jgi:hypothetical protein
VSGVSTKRCEACRELALAVDHGRAKTVGETRYVETKPNGDTVYRCVCGALVIWERQHESTVVR